MAFREIYGLGQQARIQALPLAELEALADALLDFQSAADLMDWAQLAQPAS